MADNHIVRTQRSSDTSGTVNWIITLVHGTWGQGFRPSNVQPKSGPRWFEDGSRFFKHLRETLIWQEVENVEIQSFRWSGENSILARDAAGRELARLLEEQREAYPDVKQLVIAHSHGGNVALRAIEYLGWRVGPLASEHDLAVATMATPFVELFPPRRNHFNWYRYQFFFSMMATFAGAAVFNLLPWPQIVYVSSLMLMVVAIPYELYKEYSRRQQPVPNAYVDRLCKCTSHGTFERSNIPLLVLRGVDDEANLTLAAGAVANRIMRFFSDTAIKCTAWYLPPIGIGLVVGLAAVSMAAMLSEQFLHMISPGFRLLSSLHSYLYLLWLPFPTVMLLLLVSSACNAVYGRELFLRFLNTEISANSVPDASGSVTVRTLVEGGLLSHKMRHFLYDDDECGSTIVNWAKCRFDNKPYVSDGVSRRMLSIPHNLIEKWRKGR
ncbi:alpha/beta hydrolase [Azospirillum sp. TSA2s]|uniref:alpha/beta hydrolase n=1 Tax=Azospirillum sp. TSA2s TaxID=709810 RepID=UPI0010AB39DA|nr:alpha/beta hydrolase [Azospirillum sp. TSA2s]QCG94468.1 alpha/beta hydrolase [Azospirillum sp. TSA2s]